MIRLSCSGCDSPLKISLRLAGTTGKCPSCGSEIQIPNESPDTLETTDETKSTNDDAAFDPMDVLGGADEPPAADNDKRAGHETTTNNVSEGPVSELDVEATPPDHDPVAASSDASPKPGSPTTSATGTAAAAGDVVSAMQNRVPVPTQSSSQSPELDETSATSASHNIREKVAKNKKLYLALAGSLLLALIVYMPKGCNQGIPRYPVSGRVVFSDGSPVRTGVVEFESVEFQLSATGRIQEDGSFACPEGVPAGTSRAIVTQMIISDGTILHQKDHGKPVAYHFRRYETSGLKFDIEPNDQNNIRVVVESQAVQKTGDNYDNE